MARRVTDAKFVELLTSFQVRMRAYALSLVRRTADADDVLQNACLTLWEKRDQYDADRQFFPWACGVVLIEVLRYRRKTATDKLMLDEVLINTLAAEYLEQANELESRRQLLQTCIAKLSPRDRKMLEDRYRSNIKPKEMSKNLGWPLSTVYSALTRIRESLYRCIETESAQRAHPKYD